MIEQRNLASCLAFLGLRGTLYFCLALYGCAAFCAFFALKWLAVLLFGIYAALMLRSLAAGTESGVMRIYRVFPLVNTLAGAAIFWLVLWGKAAFWPRF